MLLSPLIKLSLDNSMPKLAEVFEVEHDAEKGGRRIVSNKEPKTIDVSSSPSLSASLDVLFSLFKSATLASFPFCQHFELPTKPTNKFVAAAAAASSSSSSSSNNKAAQLREQRRVQQLQKLLPQGIELLDVNLRQISALGNIADILRTAPFELVPAGEGETGTLFIVCSGEPIAVFKPIDANLNDEENGSSESNVLFLPSGLESSDAPIREVAAYLMDNEGIYGVPATALCKITHPQFQSQGGFKIGSIQEFVQNDYAAWDNGSSDFPADEVHKIAILDMLIFNCDRHGGNILVVESNGDGKAKKSSKEEDFGEGSDDDDDEDQNPKKNSTYSQKKQFKLIPIDQGFSLPDHIESDIWFEWLNWRQSKQPLSPQLRKFVESIDPEHCSSILKGLRIKPKCIRVMKCSSLLLKKGVEAGLTVYEIGQMYVAKRSKKQNEPSDLERLVQIATERERKLKANLEKAIPKIHLDSDPDSLFMSILGDLIDNELSKKTAPHFESSTTSTTTTTPTTSTTTSTTSTMKQNLSSSNPIETSSNNNTNNINNTNNNNNSTSTTTITQKKRTSADSQQQRRTSLATPEPLPQRKRTSLDLLTKSHSSLSLVSTNPTSSSVSLKNPLVLNQPNQLPITTEH